MCPLRRRWPLLALSFWDDQEAKRTKVVAQIIASICCIGGEQGDYYHSEWLVPNVKWLEVAEHTFYSCDENKLWSRPRQYFPIHSLPPVFHSFVLNTQHRLHTFQYRHSKYPHISEISWFTYLFLISSSSKMSNQSGMWSKLFQLCSHVM